MTAEEKKVYTRTRYLNNRDYNLAVAKIHGEVARRKANKPTKSKAVVTFTDNTIMSFGQHKGLKLINVPAHYLIYLSEQPTWDVKSPLGQYVADNMDSLKAQAKADKFLKR